MVAADITPPAGAPAKARPGLPVLWDARATDLALGAAAVAGVLGLWEALSRTGVLDTQVFPAASTVLVELWRLLGTGVFWGDLWATLSSALTGLALVVLIGTVAAMLIGLIRFVENSTWVVVEFLKPIPPIALIPLGLLLWGPSPTMKVTLITFGALWPFLTQMVYGIRQTNNVALDMASSYRLGWWLTTTRIVVPTLLPYALTGLRISASIAVIVSVVTELIGGAEGIGQTIAVAQINNALPTMYAYILTAGLLGVGINLVFQALEKPLLFWHPSQRGDTN
ncbi:nitrate ABC transporter permease [Kocuria dechangensis]|uniref:Nitrate ABC transporter permease n=1 Tax=Kocuria dechangensis TaxID=1176249 RepID=A0A917LW12_9MICC|nr:ABC transporter permease [Kocuria dechangensis]GGG61502.1 nitrate ABC transporter permease [Kocuria dechangensis]